jgi:hypothetical protein
VRCPLRGEPVREGALIGKARKDVKSSEYFRKLALRQWDLFAAVAVVVLLAVSWKVLTPFGKDVFSSVKNVYDNMTQLNKADSIALLPELTRMKADKIDSCMKSISSVRTVSEQAVPGAVYTLANQSGIKASKVEISGKTIAEQGTQIPVSFKGEGDYAACGKFLDGVENMQPAGRVLELNMKNTGSGVIGLFVNFVLIAPN